MTYINPHCLNDAKPCAPDGDGGCQACDRVFEPVEPNACRAPDCECEYECDPESCDDGD